MFFLNLPLTNKLIPFKLQTYYKSYIIKHICKIVAIYRPLHTKKSIKILKNIRRLKYLVKDLWEELILYNQMMIKNYM
jgi:hypothetical protein